MKEKPTILNPFNTPVQYFLSNALQQGQMLEQILHHIGKCDILVTSFSTAEEFLAKAYRLKQEGLIGRATILLDMKAVEKTAAIRPMISRVFDETHFAPNHSKCMVIRGEGITVTTFSSQNTTRGGRLESYVITTDIEAAQSVLNAFNELKTFKLKTEEQ